MLTALGAIVLGLALLIWSADQFISGAIESARELGLSPMLIGLTLVAFGTSAPEVLVSVMAAVTGAGDVAVGNAIGSNIANLSLVLGLTAVITPLAVAGPTRRLEIPLLAGITLGTWVLFIDDYLGPADGFLMLAILAASFTVLVRYGQAATILTAEVPDPHPTSTAIIVVQILGGLLVLLGSSRLLVWGAVEFALIMGVSELVVGLTVVAVGTSLPELGAGIASALKGRHDMVLGNLIGSNLFNLLLVLAVPAIVAGIPLNQDAVTRDYGAMVLVTFLLAGIALIAARTGHIGRSSGVILLGLYVSYIVIILVVDAPAPAVL